MFEDDIGATLEYNYLTIRGANTEVEATFIPRVASDSIISDNILHNFELWIGLGLKFEDADIDFTFLELGAGTRQAHGERKTGVEGNLSHSLLVVTVGGEFASLC